MKMDQVAFYAKTEEDVLTIKRWFGLEGATWISDKVTAHSEVTGIVNDLSGTNVADLQFNYDLGVELEIITYISGPNWHEAVNPSDLDGSRFISHVGLHLGDDEDFPTMEGATLVQETWTNSHTSEYLTTGPGAGRKYHYRIFEICAGSYVKYIKRIHPEAK